jgi:hypothetical protein
MALRARLGYVDALKPKGRNRTEAEKKGVADSQKWVESLFFIILSKIFSSS